MQEWGIQAAAGIVCLVVIAAGAARSGARGAIRGCLTIGAADMVLAAASGRPWLLAGGAVTVAVAGWQLVTWGRGR